MRRANQSALILLTAMALASAGTGRVPASAKPSASADRPAAQTQVAAAEAAIVRPASLTRVKGGYYYSAWGTDNRLTVKRVEGGLRFRDPRAVRWQRLARACEKQRVRRGVAAICRVPRWVTPSDPLTIEMELRLGDDYVDTTTLGPEFRASVLADAGREEIRLGAGDDFVNGAFDRDRVWGGPGNDFLRTGGGADVAYGGLGRDRLVGGERGDLLHGNEGNDRVEGGPGADTLYGDAGADRIKCGDGSDTAQRDPADERFSCEHAV